MLDQIIQDLIQKQWSHQRGVISAAELRSIACLFEGDFLPARVGKKGARQRVEEIRGDWISWIDVLDPPAEVKQQIRFLNELKTSVNQNLFLGLKDFECHLAKYPVGTFYKRHIDRHAKESSRALTYIFYLHEDWKAEDGGELVIYHRNGEKIATITPESGSLVAFISDEFPHEVLPAKRERRSMTGWMHTQIIN
jgi:SM-20-related protein